jgi:hypothetical protein
MNARTACVEGTFDELEEVLRREFDQARRELADAARAQEQRDTPAARRWLAECRSDLDVILDVWNAAAVPAPN